MPFQISYYTSFSGMTSMERRALVRFIQANGRATGKQVSEAIDYALKRKPSFGGHILSARLGRKIAAALVVNRTGMKGYGPSHLMVFAAMNRNLPESEEALLRLVERAIDLTQGDLALQVKPDSAILPIFEKIGFQPHYLQLRLERPVVPA